MMPSTTQDTLSLDELSDTQEATVVSVQAVAESVPLELVRRLIEIGFLPGERVRIVSRGMFGGTPVAVRVGTATFALRKIEAQCVRVTLAEAERAA